MPYLSVYLELGAFLEFVRFCTALDLNIHVYVLFSTYALTSADTAAEEGQFQYYSCLLEFIIVITRLSYEGS